MEFSGFPTCCPFHACLKSKQPQEKKEISPLFSQMEIYLFNHFNPN